MTKEMSERRSGFGWVTDAGTLLLIVCTLLASILIALGTWTNHETWKEYGIVLTIPALVASLAPIFCAGLLISIWFARDMMHGGHHAPARSPRVSIDVFRPMRGPNSTRGGIQLSEEQILKLLEMDEVVIDEGITTKAQSTLTAPTCPTDVADPLPSDDPMIEAAQLGIPCRKIDDQLYVVQVPKPAKGPVPLLNVQEISTRILDQPRHVNLVLDGRKVDQSSLDGFCDCIYSLFDQLGDLAMQSFRVVVSGLPSFIEHLWKCVQKHTRGMEKVRQVDIYSKLLIICLGLPKPAAAW